MNLAPEVVLIQIPTKPDSRQLNILKVTRRVALRSFSDNEMQRVSYIVPHICSFSDNEMHRLLYRPSHLRPDLAKSVSGWFAHF